MSARPASIRSASTSRTRAGQRFSKGAMKMQPKIIVALALFLLPILSGQQPPAGSKRVPATPRSVPPLLQQYDFGGQLQTLEDSGRLPSDVKPELATPGVPSAAVPKDYRPKSD